MVPILYSYRRCPYALRARLALAFARIDFEVREINFHNKPPEMLELSPKGTVPVLVLYDDKGSSPSRPQVIDESLDIVLYAKEKAEEASNCIFLSLTDDQKKRGEDLFQRLHNLFIPHLNRYKYPDRYPNDELIQDKGLQQASLHYRESCRVFVDELSETLLVALQDKPSFLLGLRVSHYDVLLFPFIRQFRVADRVWFDEVFAHEPICHWLTWFFDHPLYEKIMRKYKPWLDVKEEGPFLVTF